MKPVQLQNPDVVLTAPPGMENCGDLTAVRFEDHESGQSGYLSVWEFSPAEIRAICSQGKLTVAINCAPESFPPIALGIQDMFGNLVEG